MKKINGTVFLGRDEWISKALLMTHIINFRILTKGSFLKKQIDSISGFINSARSQVPDELTIESCENIDNKETLMVLLGLEKAFSEIKEAKENHLVLVKDIE